MTSLKIALLLSLAPLSLSANDLCEDNKGCCDDRSSACQTTECQNAEAPDNERFGELFELVVFDAAAAYEANTAYVSITGANLSAECQQFILQLLSTVYERQPDTQTATSLTYVFNRTGLTTFGWF